MKWLRQHKRDLYLCVRNYFGEEYSPEYGLDDIDGDEYVAFFQEPSTDGREQSWSDDYNDEPLPF